MPEPKDRQPSAPLHPQQAESVARLAVSAQPDSPRLWLQLLERVEINGDIREYARLATNAQARFPQDDTIRQAAAMGMAQIGKLDEAVRLLQDAVQGRTQGASPVSPGTVMLLAELVARAQPGACATLLDRLSQRAGPQRIVDLGLRAARQRASLGPAGPLVALMADSDWHVWVMESIADALHEAGIAHVIVQRVAGLAACRPEVVLLSGPMPSRMSLCRTLLPRARFINTRHGVSVNGKNYGLYSAAACDFVCASSADLARDMAQQAVIDPRRVWVTGYPQMDGFLRSVAKQVGGRAGGRAGGRTVLFAPTFNELLSAAYLTGDDPVSAIRGRDDSVRVVLAPHPHLRYQAPQMLARWQALARERANVEYFDTARANTVDRLADADVLVSDVSSMATQYVITDRPLIRLIDPARAARSGAHVSEGTEAEVAAVSHTVTSAAALAATVRRCLGEPDPAELRERRAALRQYLFGDCTDGRAGERIARHVIDLLGHINTHPRA